ncbi:MAG: 2-C-methyl-D-erythritol 4-phosphate cytidylyltransferase [Lachnospiraceae bacterium]|nr:2-C-methyl-D-erythritol 4-phosphate cytidylyltransferase [Lachnospiraceae bacterium]
MGKTVAIVLAAGRGKRMQSDVAKQYLLVRNKPVLYYSLKAFQDSLVDEIILVTAESEIAYCKDEIVEKYAFSKVSQIVAGGKERYHSVHNGLKACEDADIVLIHDGARPFVDDAIIARNINTVKEYGACVTGMPVKDTIKISDAEGFVQETPRRDLIWTIQTPQTFRYDLIRNAYDTFLNNEEENCKLYNVTDDAMVAELFGGLKVKLVEGSYNNVKITTPEDMLLAEAILG